MSVDHDLGDIGIAQVRLQRAVTENLVGDLLSHPRPVGDGQRRLVSLQHRLERLSDLELKLALVEVGVIELGTEDLEQTLVDAALDRRERIGRPPGPPARAAWLLERRGGRRHPLGQPVGQAHADRLLPLVRPGRLGSAAPAGSSSRCWANREMAWLTG